MLKYKYKSIRFTENLRLHTENLTYPSLLKEAFIRTLSTKKLFLKSGRGPARVEERLIRNLEGNEIVTKSLVEWVLNVHSKTAWTNLNFESNNLILGPNIEFENEYVKHKVESMENSLILVPSEWVIPVLRARIDWFKGKYHVWKSDVDLDFWRPNKSIKKSQVLIYRKNDDRDDDFREIVKFCSHMNLKYCVVEYGKYNQKSFRRELRKSFFVIWLGMTESQGIALLESWATGVPTLIRESKTYFDEITGKIFPASAAPYLTAECGQFFTSGSLSLGNLQSFMENAMNLKPRKYVEENYSKIKIVEELRLLLTRSDSNS